MIFDTFVKCLDKFWKRKWWEIILILTISIILISWIFKPNSSGENYDFSFLYKNKYPKRNKKNVLLSPVQENNTEKKPNDPGYVSKAEQHCRFVLEKVFNKPFYKVRPEFLKNDVTGKNLELDLFNPELKLCVEINGRQHYEYTPYFHKNYESFLNQRYRDEMKKTKCRENGVKFIEIPYTVKIEDIENFVRNKATELGYSI